MSTRTSKVKSENGRSDVEEGNYHMDTDTSITTQSDEQERSSAPPERALRRSAALRALPGIVLHVFQIKVQGKLEPYEDAYVGLNDALMASKDPAPSSKKQLKTLPSYWVHVDADERDRIELNEWIDRLQLGTFISEQIKKPAEEWLSHVVSTRSKALIMIRILPLMSKDCDFVSNQVEYLAAVKTKNLLLTYTTTQSGGRNNLSKESIGYLCQDECLQNGSSSAALISWLEFHILRTRKALTSIRKKALKLVKEMDLEPANVQLDEILDIRDNLLVVLAVSEEQSQCLAMIKDMDKDTDHHVGFLSSKILYE